MRAVRLCFHIAVIYSACTTIAFAEDDLQAKLANPVADLISVPLQWSTYNGAGPLETPRQTLNIQPVYPMSLGSGWSLINRAILPLSSDPGHVPGQDRVTGLGDITYEGFFAPTPTKKGGLIWGFGPILVMPTATDDRLGQGKWQVGPAFLALQETQKWTIGGLVTQVWSVAGDDQRKQVNYFSLQPILSYRINPKYSLGYIGTVTGDWTEHQSGERWTIPIGAALSVLTKPKNFVPLNFSAGVGYNAVKPSDAPDWYFRFQVTLIFPK